MRKFSDILSITLFFILAVAMIISLVFFAKSCSKEPSAQSLSISVSYADSLKQKPVYSRDAVDSLLSVVRGYDLELDERYKYLLDKRTEDERYKNLVIFIMGIAASLFAFFGFRSLKDIKENSDEIAKKTAESTAKDTASKVASKKAESKTVSYLNENLNSAIQKVLVSSYNDEPLSVIKQQILDELSSDLNQKFDTLRSEVTNTNPPPKEGTDSQSGEKTDEEHFEEPEVDF